MSTALYRRYRSTSFDEVIGQDHIIRTLKNTLKSGSIAHAYLLTGPRGVGKTSVARILAFAVNGMDYKKDATHLDIIEIDAASNRRIDEIRELRERVHIAPSSAKYKVYIIDEVHMLTREAFNALLKTLEEPPAHVIFILATTEIHKLPDTIVSRCITFTFRPISKDAIAAHLKYISVQEKLSITEGALALLAIHGDGSFRDSISLLDQIKHVSAGKIDIEDIEQALGLASTDQINKIIGAVTAGDPEALNTVLEESYKAGATDTNLARQLSEELRSQLLSGKSSLELIQITALLEELLDVPASPKPRARLELTLLKQLFKQPTPVVSEIALPPQITTTRQKIPETKASATIRLDSEIWQNTLKKLKVQNNTIYGIARMAETELEEGSIILKFKFPFHFKQISQAKNRAVLTAIIQELGHSNLSIDIRLRSDTIDVPKFAQKNDKDLTSINNIFGGGEMIES